MEDLRTCGQTIDASAAPRMAGWVTSVLLGSPVAHTLGIRLVALEADRVVMALPFKPDNVTLGRIVHGGVIATLIDIFVRSARLSAAVVALEKLCGRFRRKP